MSQRCSVCRHESREKIDAELLAGREGSRTLREIGHEYGMSHSALIAHRRNHITPQAASAAEITRTEYGAGLVDRIERLVSTVQGVIDRAEEQGNDTRVLQAARELRPTFDLLARIAGELKTSGTVYHQQYVDLRVAVMDGLCTQCRASLGKALLRIESS